MWEIFVCVLSTFKWWNGRLSLDTDSKGHFTNGKSWYIDLKYEYIKQL